MKHLPQRQFKVLQSSDSSVLKSRATQREEELTICGQRESRRSHVLSPPPSARREETPSLLEFEFIFGGRMEMGESMRGEPVRWYECDNGSILQHDFRPRLSAGNPNLTISTRNLLSLPRYPSVRVDSFSE